MKSFSSYILEKFKITKKTIDNNDKSFITNDVLYYLEDELHYSKDEDFKIKTELSDKENCYYIDIDFSLSDYFDSDSARKRLCEHIIDFIKEKYDYKIKIDGNAIAPYQVNLKVKIE